MHFDADFHVNDMTLAADFSESSQPVKANMGIVNIVHDGQNGATFTPSVSLDGVLTWENDRDLPNPAPVNIKGPQGEKGATGAPGADGKDGSPGKDGTDGKTPVKGTDYFTEADKAEMVAAVVNALPVYDGEVVAV